MTNGDATDGFDRYFETRIPVRFADTDANGHVFFANYLVYFDTALLDYLNAIGYEFKRFTDQGLNFFYAEALSSYKAAAGFGDTLRVRLRISRFGNSSFTIAFRVLKGDSEAPINTGHIVAVVVGLESGRPAPIPPDFIETVKNFSARLLIADSATQE